MADDTFPPYSSQYAKTARETKMALSPALRCLADQIEDELSDDPDRYPERTSPASVRGSSRIYRHPDPELWVVFEIDRTKKILYFFHYFAPTAQPVQSIFVSYAHTDREWLDKQRPFFKTLEDLGLIKFWDDSQIKAGSEWEKALREALTAAKAALLLVSQEFLASNFVNKVELPELRRAAESKGKRIFWLPLRPTTVFDTHPEITKYQSILDNPQLSLAERDEAAQLKAMSEVIRKLKESAELN